MSFKDQNPRIMAILGPTNTGKTYLAIDRMLGHQSGMIGFPLRLLARENYDRVVKLVGNTKVALITGEEKIIPKSPCYFICTVESMPISRLVDFMAIDEIQLCADPERGHVFTDRLLNARGRLETMFLGALSIKSVMKLLIPKIKFTERPRFSKLSYTGPKKLNRISKRSAVVAFSANDVYSLAEKIRSNSGGTAVVLGALSPRTRNAQVEMYQSGEVDYLVATDAIGMGLNMDIDHVAFSSLKKFDGIRLRALRMDEIGQIAGRAGRHLNDGSFGTLSETGKLAPETIEAIENHLFQRISRIWWRNKNLKFKSVKSLLKSLDLAPPFPVLRKVRETEDRAVLRQLSSDPEILRLVANPDLVRVLWDVCQIPDYRKTMLDAHVRLLARIYRYLASSENLLPTDWVAKQLVHLERVDGDIDTLMARIAHTRTWTYISHRSDWLDDAQHWQQRARAIEDSLSDALHDRLTKRFVDRRNLVLVRSRKPGQLNAEIDEDNSVFVEGTYLGKLTGLKFIPDLSASMEDRRLMTNAAHKVLQQEIKRRVEEIEKTENTKLALNDDGKIIWNNNQIGRLIKGNTSLSPKIKIDDSNVLNVDLRERVHERLSGWYEQTINKIFNPLFLLEKKQMSGAAKGIWFQLCEGLGSVPRALAQSQIRALTTNDRRILRSSQVRIGFQSVFVVSLFKSKIIKIRALLWSIWNGRASPLLPKPGVKTVFPFPSEENEFFNAIGFVPVGNRLVRVDILDRVSLSLRGLAKSGQFDFPKNLSGLLGIEDRETKELLENLGYKSDDGGNTFRRKNKKKYRIFKKNRRYANMTKKNTVRKGKVGDPNSPFARLSDVKF